MKIGLLPLYISLYDLPATAYLRDRLSVFYEKIATKFEENGVEVVRNEFCTEEPQFEKAVELFENSACDAIVTLHMAYSPSLKSEKILKNTKLPIIVCDTTETFDFSDEQDPVEVLYCHGIHGVMDMCNLLKKNKKVYTVVAGHYEEDDVIERTIGFVKAAKAANALKGSRIGRVGGDFDGMGDFLVSEADMKKYFDATIIYPEKGEFEELAKTVTQDEIKKEKERNANDFVIDAEFDEDVYTASVIADLTLKKWIEKKELDAFTINFNNTEGLTTMPFNGVCRAMEDGIGYAGEGDTLTALFSGALLKGYKGTSFIEIFCPDWKNNTIYISHMGEMNYALSANKPVLAEKDFAYGENNPITATASFKPGKGVFFNIYEDDKGFNAFIAPVKIVEEKTQNFKGNIRGWLDFEKPVTDVLEKISECGATHHSVLIYDAKPEEISFFAKCLGINPVIY